MNLLQTYVFLLISFSLCSINLLGLIKDNDQTRHAGTKCVIMF